MSKITDFTDSNYVKMDAVGLNRVHPGDSLLQQRRDVNHNNSLQYQYEECERTGRIDNFRIAAGEKEGEISKHLAADSDIYKWLEAAAYDLAAYPESEEKTWLENKINEVIDLIARAQEENGYLDTTFLYRKEERWQDLDHGHELYCGGHLIQAAAAHHRATGENILLDVAIRWADYICDKFGPDGEDGSPGHPEVEMGLVELYRETGTEKYLKLSQFFIEQRGQETLDGSRYIQDHLPIREQTTMEGHAVRQLYLTSGITDIYAETGDESLLKTLKQQWHNFTEKKMAITGGAGAKYEGEAFGLDYELHNRIGYYETCAAIASFMWNWRMLQVTGKVQYADIMELTLYNGLLSGVSLDGLKYFYTNPLEHDGGEDISSNHRGSNRRTSKHWDYTACCPPNMARLLASLPGYIYSKDEQGLYINHYTASSINFTSRGTNVVLIQKTSYPWYGKIDIEIQTEENVEFSLKLRIPGWVNNPQLRINDRIADIALIPGTYVEITRKWSQGDKVSLNFPMSVSKMTANVRATNNAGCAVLKRGPVVYCIESVDYPGIDIYNIVLPQNGKLEDEYRDDLLNGVVVIKGEALIIDKPDRLYSSADKLHIENKVDLLAVPYFAWANRKPGAMRVWLPVE